jgi:hypothetical protein
MAWVMKSMADCLNDIDRDQDYDMEEDGRSDMAIEERQYFDTMETVNGNLEKHIFKHEAQWMDDFDTTNLRCIRGGIEAGESHHPGTFYIDGHYESDEVINRNYEINKIFEVLPSPFVYGYSISAQKMTHYLIWVQDDYWKMIEMTKLTPDQGGANDEDIYFYIMESADDLFSTCLQHISTTEENTILAGLGYKSEPI